MKEFRISDNYNIICEWKKTRTAFKHTATLLKNGYEIDKTKICYLNRTWESFDFQSVLHKIIDKNFKDKEKEQYIKEVDSQGSNREGSFLKTVGMVAKFGEIFCDKQEDKNKFKKRILGTIKGIDFPEDFDKLPAVRQNNLQNHQQNASFRHPEQSRLHSHY